MPIIEILFLLYLTITIVLVLIRTRREAIAIKRQHYIERCTSNDTATIDFLGCSIICTYVEDIKHIELLLTSNFYRSEVILSLNSTNQRELFHSIIKKYKLVEVNNSFPQEITSSPIIALYRSRQRGYRRLIVVDSSTSDQYEALNIALNISSYDYIIPIPMATYLRPNAISAIAISLSLDQNLNPELIYCKTATPCYIFHRDALIDRGGFSMNIIKEYPQATKLYIFFPLLQRYEPSNDDNTLITIIFTIITIASITLCLLLMTLQITLCIIATIALAFAAARYILILDNRQNCSVRTILYQISNITTFFRSRKFNIS